MGRDDSGPKISHALGHDKKYMAAFRAALPKRALLSKTSSGDVFGIRMWLAGAAARPCGTGRSGWCVAPKPFIFSPRRAPRAQGTA